MKIEVEVMSPLEALAQFKEFIRIFGEDAETFLLPEKTRDAVKLLERIIAERPKIEKELSMSGDGVLGYHDYPFKDGSLKFGAPPPPPPPESDPGVPKARYMSPQTKIPQPFYHPPAAHGTRSGIQHEKTDSCEWWCKHPTKKRSLVFRVWDRIWLWRVRGDQI